MDCVKNWDESQIKQFNSEIEWIREKIKHSKSNKEKQELMRQIRKKELEIAFN